MTDFTARARDLCRSPDLGEGCERCSQGLLCQRARVFEAAFAAVAREERARAVRWKAAVTAIHTTVIKAWPAWGAEDRRFLALALAGEVGEVANLVKKEWRGDALPNLVADLAEGERPASVPTVPGVKK